MKQCRLNSYCCAFWLVIHLEAIFHSWEVIEEHWTKHVNQNKNKGKSWQNDSANKLNPSSSCIGIACIFCFKGWFSWLKLNYYFTKLFKYILNLNTFQTYLTLLLSILNGSTSPLSTTSSNRVSMKDTKGRTRPNKSQTSTNLI